MRPAKARQPRPEAPSPLIAGVTVTFTVDEAQALDARLWPMAICGADERAAEAGIRKLHCAVEACR